VHIVLGALALIITLLILLNRLADAGIDLGGLNPFLWHRRRKWRGQFDANPLFLISDPKEIAAVLAVGVAKIDGDMTVEDKRALLQEFESTFAMKPRGASELLGSSVHLLGDPAILVTHLDTVLARGREKFTSEQVMSTLAMLERIAGASSSPSQRQRELIDAVRARLSSMRPAGTWA
jgi:hypothetical protein